MRYWGVSPSLWQGPLLFCQREGPHHTFQPQEPRDKKQLRGAGSFLPPCSGDSGLRAWQQTPFSSNQISILHTLPNAGWCYRSTAWTPDTLLLPSLATSTSIHQYRTQKFCFFSFNSTVWDYCTVMQWTKWALINIEFTVDRDADITKDQLQREIKDTKNNTKCYRLPVSKKVRKS